MQNYLNVAYLVQKQARQVDWQQSSRDLALHSVHGFKVVVCLVPVVWCLREFIFEKHLIFLNTSEKVMKQKVQNSTVYRKGYFLLQKNF